MTTPLAFDATLRDRSVTSGFQRIGRAAVETGRKVGEISGLTEKTNRSVGSLVRESGRGFVDLGRKTAGFGKSVTGLLNPLHALGELPGTIKEGFAEAIGHVGLEALIEQVRESTKAASDLHESQSAVEAIFGKSAKAIEGWSTTTAKSMGLSQSASLEATLQFGDMFQQLHFTRDASLGMSKRVVQLAADLGSFRNVEPSDVLERISAGFRGEYDSLQLLIPNISAARVQQEALAETHKKSEKDLTAAEKATATLNIIQKDGIRSSGDFARTSSGLANQQRILSAQFENTRALLGQRLLPTVLKVATGFGSQLPSAIDLVGNALDKATPVIEKFWAASQPARAAAVAAGLTLIHRAGAGLSAVFSDFKEGFNLGQSATVVQRFGVLVYTVLQRIGSNWHDLQTGFQQGLGTSQFAEIGKQIYGLGQSVVTVSRAFREGGLNAAIADLEGRFPGLSGDIDNVKSTISDLAGIVRDLAKAIEGNQGSVKLLASTFGGPTLTALRLFSGALASIPGLATAVLYAYIGWQVIPPIIAGVSTAVSVYRGVKLGLAAASAGEALAENASTAAKIANKAAVIGSGIAYAATRSTIATFVGVKAIELATWVRSVAVMAVHTAGLLASRVAMLAVRGATIAWSVAQAALNFVLTANPIGLVVVGIAALVAGVILAYKHSEKFRAVLKLLWDGLKEGARIAVTLVLGYIDTWLGALEGVLHVMGKLPGPFGKPFRAAADAIQGVRDKVNGLKDNINGLKGKDVNVGVNIKGRDLTVVTGAGTTGGGGRNFRLAGGGLVPGPLGGSSADKQPVLATAGEFMVNRQAYQRASRLAPGLIEAINAGTINLAALDIGGDISRARIAPVGDRLKFATGGLISQVQRFIRSTDPLPYIWGAGGPFGYDCSGLVGAVYGKLTGRGGGSGQRYFTTGSIGGVAGSLGLRSGLGTFSIGVTAGTGHMVGNLAGLGFEARSTKSGIIIGSGATSPAKMARHYFLPSMGGTFGGYPPLTQDQWRQLARQVEPRIAAQLLSDLGFHRADNGSILLPGQGAVNVHAGRERVLNPTQTKEWEGGGLRRGDLRAELEGMKIVFEDPIGGEYVGRLARAGRRGGR